MAYTTYGAIHGPFANGSAPGIDQSFLNAIEAMLAAGWFDSLITSDNNGGLQAKNFQTTLSPVTVNGQTTGHADMYQYMQGAVKKTIINLVNYRITANQTLALPVPYAGRALIWVGETNGGHLACLASAAAVNIKVLNSALSGTGAAPSTQTFIQNFSQGQIDAAWDTLQLQSASQLGTANGVIIIEGF